MSGLWCFKKTIRPEMCLWASKHHLNSWDSNYKKYRTSMSSICSGPSVPNQPQSRRTLCRIALLRFGNSIRIALVKVFPNCFEWERPLNGNTHSVWFCLQTKISLCFHIVLIFRMFKNWSDGSRSLSGVHLFYMYDYPVLRFLNV